MYADDHQLLVKEESAKGVAQKLNETGKKISTRYKDNFLRGNYDKYKAMLLRRTRKTGENTKIYWHWGKNRKIQSKA